MKILLDTHTLIWFSQNSNKLSRTAKYLLNDKTNQLFLSVVSVWEMQIKIQQGKLRLDLPLPEIIENQVKYNDLQILTIALEDIWTLGTLGNYHKDPFDRWIISQSLARQLPLLSIDEVFDAYNIERLW